MSPLFTTQTHSVSQFIQQCNDWLWGKHPFQRDDNDLKRNYSWKIRLDCERDEKLTVGIFHKKKKHLIFCYPTSQSWDIQQRASACQLAGNKTARHLPQCPVKQSSSRWSRKDKQPIGNAGGLPSAGSGQTSHVDGEGGEAPTVIMNALRPTRTSRVHFQPTSRLLSGRPVRIKQGFLPPPTCPQQLARVSETQRADAARRMRSKWPRCLLFLRLTLRTDTTSLPRGGGCLNPQSSPSLSSLSLSPSRPSVSLLLSLSLFSLLLPFSLPCTPSFLYNSAELCWNHGIYGVRHPSGSEKILVSLLNVILLYIPH